MRVRRLVVDGHLVGHALGNGAAALRDDSRAAASAPVISRRQNSRPGDVARGWDARYQVSGTAAAGYQRDGQPTQKGVCGSPKETVINEFRQRANAIAGSSGRKKSTREIGVRQRVCGAYERPRMRLAGRNVRKTGARDKEASPRASRKIICRLQEGQSKIQNLEKLVGKGAATCFM